MYEYSPIADLNRPLTNMSVPAIYPDGLSYYEDITKLFKKLSEVISLTNLSKQEVDDLYAYINNGGLPDIINQTLQAWYDDGTLETLINDILLADIKNNIGDDEVYDREATGYGVIIGLNVVAQENPDMSVMVKAGIAHTYNGRRYIQGQDQRIAISPANGANARWDVVLKLFPNY
jgi:hypothetical protein